MLKIHWPECEQYDIVLNTEEKSYDCDFFNIRTFHGGKGKTWSRRILDCLETINTEYVLFFLEDQFLQKRVNDEWFIKSFEYMKANENVGVIFLRHTGKQKTDFNEDYFSRHLVTDQFPIVGMVALYRKAYLQKLASPEESVWQFESRGSARSKVFTEEVLQYNKRNPEIFVYDDQIQFGMGITQGKWLPKNKELFEKHGIEVDFDKIGVLSIEEALENLKRPIVKKKIQLNPIEIAYNIKKRIKRIKNRDE